MTLSLRHIKKSLLNFFLPMLAALLKALMTCLLKTCKIQFQGMDTFLKSSENENSLIVLWHNRLTIIPFIFSMSCPHITFAGLVSSHGDGKILSKIIGSFKNGTIIECSHKEGHLAVKAALASLHKEKVSIVITPDGPRGPYHEVKLGTAAIALKSGVKIFALHWEADRYFELNTWDKQRIPKPFSTIQLVLTPPFSFDETKGDSLNEVKQRLKDALLSAEETRFEQA